MNGVMTPTVSAGSNQVGAIGPCTAQVTWPSGVAVAPPGATRLAIRTRARARTAGAAGGNGAREVMGSVLLCVRALGAHREGRRTGPDGDGLSARGSRCQRLPVTA